MEWIANPEAWVALATLTALELVLGIDNIVFISILAGKVGEAHREFARRAGLLIAMLSRIALLFSIAWLTRLVEPLFELFGHGFSGRDLILAGGGLFLIAKATHELHQRLEGHETSVSPTGSASLAGVLVQIVLLDIVFSLDSVITAVGMVDEVAIMVAAVVLSVGFMLMFAKAVGDFVLHHPTVKILALSFLMLIGVALIADGFGQHIPRGYIYFSMAYATGVELLNMRFRRKTDEPVDLHGSFVAGGE